MHDLCYRAAVGLLAVVVEFGEGLVGLIDTVVADEIPWALRGEEQKDDEWDGPDPLNGIANAVGPAAAEVEAAIENAGGYELAGCPAIEV